MKIYQNPYKFICPVLLTILTLMVYLEMLEYYIMNSVMIGYNLECLATKWLLFIQFKKKYLEIDYNFICFNLPNDSLGDKT